MDQNQNLQMEKQQLDATPEEHLMQLAQEIIALCESRQEDLLKSGLSQLNQMVQQNILKFDNFVDNMLLSPLCEEDHIKEMGQHILDKQTLNLDFSRILRVAQKDNYQSSSIKVFKKLIDAVKALEKQEKNFHIFNIPIIIFQMSKYLINDINCQIINQNIQTKISLLEKGRDYAVGILEKLPLPVKKQVKK